jgi:PKD repeat protein
MRRLLFFAFAIFSACSESLAPLPLEIGVQASRTVAAPGDSIDFVVTAQGGQLVGIAIAFGDGSEDLFGTGGARTAKVTFRHAYSARGTYQVQATVTDALAGPKDASIEVRVN